MSRELLEKAAKAAGIDGTYYNPFTDGMEPLSDGQGPWNPLIDDGDAFRLAVKLGILNLDDALVNSDHSIDFQDDPYAATRLAIVRAAAAMEDA